MATERLPVPPVVVGGTSTCTIGIRKSSRVYIIRLMFMTMVVLCVALTVFHNTQVISYNSGQPINDAPILRNKTESLVSAPDKSLPSQVVIEESLPLPSPPDHSISKIDGAMVPETRSPTTMVQNNNALVPPTGNDTIMADNISTVQQQAASVPRPVKAPNNPLRQKRKKIMRGFQEHELERRLGWKLDFSDFDSQALHQSSSLKDFYNNIPSTTMTNTSCLWDDPQCLLPDWMKQYLRWHKYMRTTTATFVNGTATTGANGRQPFKFIVMQCLASDDHCGGVSDRLKPLPFLLRLAYYTQRMLFIYWDRPGHLEEFLLPPKAGMDWRLPPWFIPMVKNWNEGVFTFSYETLRAWTRTELPMVRSRYQDYHGGMYTYNALRMEGEIDFVQLFYHLWKIAFTPSPPVRELLESDMNRLGLVAGSYTGAHLRALYAIDDRQDHVLRNWARNAMNCATELRPRKPIFFVSDSNIATKHAQDYARAKNATIITRIPNPNPPLHIDKVYNWRSRKMTDFYDSFVDIYIMAHADCMTYNKGGYGILGLYMSRNSSCGLRQDAIDSPRIRNPCTWVDDPLNGTESTKSSRPLHPDVSNERIYLDPMDH